MSSGCSTWGDRPRALARNVERAISVLPAGTEVVPGDVTDPASLRTAVDGVGAVILTHGAPYGSGEYEAIDYGAVPALLEALAGRRVRVALMTSIGVAGTGGSSRDLLRWKQRGERLLRASGMPYTIVRPGWFDAGTGREPHIDLRQGDSIEYGPVRRAHVADSLVQAIRTDSAIGKTLEVFSSDGPAISDWNAAFNALTSDQPGGPGGALDRQVAALDSEPARVQGDVRRWGTEAHA